MRYINGKPVLEYPNIQNMGQGEFVIGCDRCVNVRVGTTILRNAFVGYRCPHCTKETAYIVTGVRDFTTKEEIAQVMVK